MILNTAVCVSAAMIRNGLISFHTIGAGLVMISDSDALACCIFRKVQYVSEGETHTYRCQMHQTHVGSTLIPSSLGFGVLLLRAFARREG